MAIESATYLSDLVSANPPGTDPLSQADNHIRLIKGVLKNTFPNLNASCSATPLQLNGYFVPQGAIVMWSGTTAPTGWALCDGGTYSKSDGSGSVVTPNLTDKFIICKGTNAVGSTGGSSSVTPTITVTNASYTLTTADLPSHTHTATVTDPTHSHTLSDPGHSHTYSLPGSNSNAAGLYGNTSGSPSTVSTGSASTGITVASSSTGISVTNASTGGGGGHTHANTAVCSSVATVPPFYALAFIYKL